jgi:hypothetical protein
MALQYMAGRMNIRKAAAEIMRTLPVCKIRRISYATFTIIDIDSSGVVNIIEYDNPSYLLFRDDQLIAIDKIKTNVVTTRKKPATLYVSEFKARDGDRIIFYSDGLNQSGIGTSKMPLGWGSEGVRDFVTSQIKTNPLLSAKNLAQTLVKQATVNDAWKNGDDTTCGVIFFRKPRQLIVFTGPPLDQCNDSEIAMLCKNFKGQKVICGGTTAKIISRELNQSINVDLRNIHPEIPPLSIMDGVDLVTEGIITLTKTAEYLENMKENSQQRNAAHYLRTIFLENDEVSFIVGTRLNDANRITGNQHVELRHAIIRRISGILEQKYLKKVSVRYI